MKKLSYSLLGIILITSMFSCEKEESFDSDLLKSKKTTTAVEAKTSDSGVMPEIIPGDNRGGNRTCAEVGLHFKDDADYFDLCGEKVDYNDQFEDAFPDGLEVTVTDRTFVEFKMDDCIMIGDSYYKVGAVIVKGSNAANVYFYEDGILHDSGLSAPVNPSGKPAGLSNLTFCFIECEPQEEEIVMAMKTYIMSPDSTISWAATRGTGSENDVLKIGYHKISTDGITLYLTAREAKVTVASITITKMTDSEDNDYLNIVAEFTDAYSDYTFEKSHLYVGSVDGYLEYVETHSGQTDTDYASFPFYEDESTAPRVFNIYYSEITE